MSKLNKILYDNLNREYERRNLYLYDIAKLQEKIKNADKEEKKALKKKLSEFIRNKKENSYIKNFNKFKEEEKKLNERIKIEIEPIQSDTKIALVTKLEKDLRLQGLKMSFIKSI